MESNKFIESVKYYITRYGYENMYHSDQAIFNYDYVTKFLIYLFNRKHYIFIYDLKYMDIICFTPSFILSFHLFSY